MIIVDANLIGALFLRSEQTPLAARIFERDPDWYAPLLWQSEVRSLLTSYLRHKLITLDKAAKIMEEVHALMMEHERHVSSSLVLELVAASRCTSYDCEYVALAKEMKLTLVTFDKEIVGEFPGTAIFPQDFVNL
jgi:predicted nucleic acid-binding protein